VVNRAGGSVQHHRFYELPELLRPGDVLVMNNSRVIPLLVNMESTSSR
jgi:S-adenosylmethionine:tRNA ribosyltransferase-isomerase